MELPRSSLLILAFSLLWPWPISWAGQAAAVIIDYQGGEAINGTRSGAPMVFQLGSILEEGDQVEIPKAGFVKINRGGECRLLLSPERPEDSPASCTTMDRATSYSVPPSGFAGDISGRYQQLAEVLGWWDPERTTKPMRSRESYGLRVPALDAIAKPLVVAGDRILHVRWVDGKPPFHLRAITSDGRQFDGVVSQGNRTGSVNIPVPDGKTVRLEVSDISKIVSYRLHGVKAFDEKGLGTPVDDYDRASRIVSLISESGGDWAFEGAQRIMTLQLEPRVKTALTDAIGFGDWP